MKFSNSLSLRSFLRFIRVAKSIILLCCLALGAALSGLAQDGTVDPTFDPGVGPIGTKYGDFVQSVASQPDGKVVIGGRFTTVDGANRLDIARLNPDGTLDGGFVPDTATGGTSYSRLVATQLDGKILLANSGSSDDGYHGGYLLRFNPDGSRDPNFLYRTGSVDFNADYHVAALVVLPDGKLLVLNPGGIKRLDSDGALDPGFSFTVFSDVDPAADYDLTALAVQPDGKIIVSGVFSTITGIPLRNFARLNADGSVDPSFLPQFVSGDNPARQLIVQPDGKILGAGSSRTVNGREHLNVTRLNPDGSFDDSFALDYPVGDGFGSSYGIALQPDGKILVNYGTNVARLNQDGTLDSGFTVPEISQPDGYRDVTSLALAPGGKVLAGGYFTMVGTLPRQHIVRLNNTAPSGTAPRLTSPTTATGTANAPFSYQLIATGNPVSYAVSDLPAGLTLNAATGLISGTPAVPGTFSLVAGATNLVGIGTAPLTLTIAAAPVPVPVITSATGGYGQTQAEFTYRITATNFPVTFSASGLPAGAVVDSRTGLISGIPRTVGTFNVTVGATNAGGTGTANVSVVVSSDAPPRPVITSASKASATIGQPFAYQITATNFPTRYVAYGLANYYLPDGLIFDENTGLLSGIPAESTDGIHGLEIEAFDVGVFDYATLTLTIYDPAKPGPVITSALSASAQVGQPFSYQITATNSPVYFYTGGLPFGIDCDVGSGLISGTPTDVGTYNVILHADNGVASAFIDGTATLTLTVTANAVPVPVITSVTSANGQVGAAFAYQIAAGNSPTSFAASGLPTGLSVNTATGLISGVPATAGSFSVGISATNAAGTGTSTLVLTFGADPTVAAPVITSGTTASVAVGQAFTYQITATNSPASFAVSELPGGLSVDTATGLVSGTPTATGTFTIGLSATNAGGTGTGILTLTIAPAVPTVILIATTPTVTAGSGNLGVFTLSLSAAQDHDVFVNFTIKGTAVNGVEYMLLKTRKKIKAGKTSKPIKITPLGTGGGAGVKRTVVLILQPDDGYEVGTTGKVKVKIIGQ